MNIDLNQESDGIVQMANGIRRDTERLIIEWMSDYFLNAGIILDAMHCL